MKRNSSQASSSSSAPTKSTKRQKTSQACNSCRKSKTRCEILGDREKGSLQCHRCKVLRIHCSYQDMERSELEESLRLPKLDKDEKKLDKISFDNALERTLKWEQEALGMIESAGDSGFLKMVTEEPNKQRFMIWDLLSFPEGRTYDWAAPLETIRELAKYVFESDSKHKTDGTTPTPEPIANDSLTQILTAEQIQYLLDMFSKHYTPWLNYTPILDAQNPMLDLVCCTVASRHLDESTRAVVAPRLQALTQQSCARLIFQSRNSDSLEAIQCLLILSLWAPLCGASEDLRDGRTLIGSAVSMAMNCRLNEACDKAFKLQTAKKKGEEVDESELVDATNKSRLWLSIANAESMLCIGSGRVALSKRNYEAYRVVFGINPTLSFFPSDLTTGRDMRLRLLAELCDATETGMAIPFQSMSEADIETWYDSLVHVFQNMSRILRLSLPLGVLAESEKFYYQMLNIHNKFFRLLLLYHALGSCRMHQRENQSGRTDLWFKEVRPRGVFLVIMWSKESFQLSEAFLISLLEMDAPFLGTAPDYLFTMIAFAAGYALASNYVILRGLGVQVPGCTMKLVERVIALLMQASVSEDSSAQKCAQLISVMFALYNARKRELLALPRQNVIEILGTYNPWQGGTGKKPEPRISGKTSPSANAEVGLLEAVLTSRAPSLQTVSSSPSPATTATSCSQSLDAHSPSSSQNSISGTNASSPASPNVTAPIQNAPLSNNSSLHHHQSSYHLPDTQTYTHAQSGKGVDMNAYAGPTPNARNNPNPSVGNGQPELDINMSNFDFGWIDNSLLQSTEFWNDYMVDMNLPGYPGFNLNTPAFPPGYDSNLHGQGPYR